MVNSRIEARHLTAMVPEWENAGAIHVSASAIGGTKVTNLPGGHLDRRTERLRDRVRSKTNCSDQPFGPELLKTPRRPFPDAGAALAEFKIPSRPVPHPAAGKFTALAAGVR